MGFINEVLIDKNDENRYQVAYDPEIFTISSFVEKIEGKMRDIIVTYLTI